MSKKRKFVADCVFYAELNEVLTRELAEDGYSGVEVRVTRELAEDGYSGAIMICPHKHKLANRIVQQRSLVRPEFLQRDVGLDARRLLENTLTYNYYPLSLVGKNYALFNTLKEYEGLPIAIIVSLPSRASNLHNLLQSCEIDSVFVHYDMDLNQRSHLLESFKTKDSKVLVMTNLEELVDLEIHLVINYDFGVYENKPRFLQKLVADQFPEGVVKEVVDFITYTNAKGRPPCFEDLFPGIVNRHQDI